MKEGHRMKFGIVPMSALEANEGEHSEPEEGGRALKPVDTEVSEKPVRRMFSVDYKLKILQEADRCRELGEVGALLRREDLYSSNLNCWRRQREQGILSGLASKKRGRKPRPVDSRDQRIRELEREKARLKKRLEEAEIIIEFQKKVSEILGIPLKRNEEES